MLIYIVLFGLILSTGLIQYSSITAINIRLGKNRYYITKSTIVFCVAFIVLTFVEAMRGPTVGEDLYGYLSWFEYYRIREVNIETLLDFSAFEPGFMILYKLIGIISTTDQAFIAVTSIVIVFLNVYFLYKNSNDFYLSILLFIGFNHFFTSMVSLRQYIAIGIVMWIIPSLREKKIVKGIIIGVIAFFFHMTSIIASIFIFISYLSRHNKKFIPVILGLTLILIINANQLFTFIMTLFVKYQQSYFLNSEVSIGYIRGIYILLEIILIIYVYFIKGKDEECVEYSILLIPAIICGILTSIPHIFRVGYYFDYVMMLLIPKIVAESNGNRFFLRLVTIIISIVFFSYYLSVNPGETVPYNFY